MQTSQEQAQGQDKIQRYNWKLSDDRGRFLEIHKDKLQFNHEDYQREAREAKVMEIARNWSWVACNSISVAHRHGQFFVMDGQYRTLAAKKRSDIKTLPCMVYDVAEVKEEAEGFLRANTNRKPITSRDRFRALVTTENENAKFVESLLIASGRKADAGHNGARCLGAMLRAAENNREELSRVWPIIDQLCDGRSVHTNILRAMIWIEGHMDDGMSLTERKWKERLLLTGYDELIDATRKAEGFVGKGGERTWAEGVIQRLNKGRQKKLIINAKGRVVLGEGE